MVHYAASWCALNAPSVPYYQPQTALHIVNVAYPITVILPSKPCRTTGLHCQWLQQTCVLCFAVDLYVLTGALRTYQEHLGMFQMPDEYSGEPKVLAAA